MGKECRSGEEVTGCRVVQEPEDPLELGGGVDEGLRGDRGAEPGGGAVHAGVPAGVQGSTRGAVRGAAAAAAVRAAADAPRHTDHPEGHE